MNFSVTYERLKNLVEALRRRMQRGELRFEGRDQELLTDLVFLCSDSIREDAVLEHLTKELLP